ncbi:MAG: hypothetical protein Q7T30_02950, partial [Planctomycetota bacterium]|nr:hypothetical protein [Planctomycetota bacterium]
MKIRFASALLALALPLFAQDPAAAAESMFYKAFYLEKGPRDFAAAMTLYEQFLAAAPDHKLASEAAKQQFGLLDRTGKTKERDAFKEKYGKLLGNVVATGAGDAPAAGDRPGRGAAGAGGERPARGEGGAGGRMDPAARIADLEKQIEKAKAEGNEEQVKALTAQLERAKAGGGRGAGGAQGGPGGGRMGGGIFGTKKLADMTAEEMTTFKEGLANIDTMVERMRERMTEEQAKGVDTNLPALKKALADNKLEDAQKALDALRESLPRGRRGGGGGEGAGAGAGGQPPAGGTAGGRGGNRGGGGGG